ncbi:MAG: hypothetical protein WDN49_22940 [Acetobacteraceae bacterium]
MKLPRLVLMMLVALVSLAAAPPPAPPAPPVTPAEAEQALAVLQDDAQRTKLIDVLRDHRRRHAAPARHHAGA